MPERASLSGGSHLTNIHGWLILVENAILFFYSGLTLLLLCTPFTLCQELLSLYGAPPGDDLYDVCCDIWPRMLPGGPAGAPSDTGLTGLGGVTDEFLALAEAIPGQPGDDYPVFSEPPDTSFTCGDKIEVGVVWTVDPNDRVGDDQKTSFSGLLRRSRSWMSEFSYLCKWRCWWTS